MDSKTITINNTTYTIGRTAPTHTGTIYEVTGKRGASGAIVVHTDAAYYGRAICVGIAALERLNWWDITNAMVDIDAACANLIASLNA